MSEYIDAGLDLEVLFEDGDEGISLSQIVFRVCGELDCDDGVTFRRWADLSAELVVMMGKGTRELPDRYRRAIKSRKRGPQMVEVAVRNTNRELQLIGHDTYYQIIAPSVLAGSEQFANQELVTKGSPRGSTGLLLCTERAVFGATMAHMTDLLLMARANRLSGVLRGAWGSNHFRMLNESDWFEYCEEDFDLYTLGAEFVASSKGIF